MGRLNAREPWTSNRPANDCRQNVEEAEDDRASFCGLRGGNLEFQEIKAGEALHRGSACDGVVAGSLPRGRASRALRYVQRNGNGSAVELIGEFGTAERKPSNQR